MPGPEDFADGLFKAADGTIEAVGVANKFFKKKAADRKLAQEQKIREKYETLGPYLVGFDSRLIDRVKIENPISGRKTLSGIGYTVYPMLLYSGVTPMGIISIARFEKPETISISDCARDTESKLRSEYGYRDVKTAFRKIDNNDGCVSVGRAQGKQDRVIFSYYPSSLTSIDVFIYLPWNQGASEMVDTFHVEESIDLN